MQMGDFKTSRQYYDAAIENMNINMPKEAIQTYDSKMMQVYAAEMAQNKFLLACRHFQMGVAAFESVKKKYPVYQLLENKASQGVLH